MIKGILCGVDDKGTFDPQGNLNRGAAATVLNRIIDSSSRENKDFSQVVAKPNQNKFDGTSEDSSPIEIIEGSVGQRRFAREGDVVIKANGERVTLRVGSHGVLGEGQNVSPDLGVQVTSGGNTTVVASNMNDGMVFSGDTDYTDSFGKRVKNQGYYVNRVTGEGHWDAEWTVILADSHPKTDGSYHYQLSEDKNWYWSADYSRWINISAQYISDNGVAKILEANGLN